MVVFNQYFDNSKIKCYRDGEYPEIGMIEYFLYNNAHYTIDQFLKNLTRYGIDNKTTKFDIYYDETWHFTVILDNYNVKSIQYWNSIK